MCQLSRIFVALAIGASLMACSPGTCSAQSANVIGGLAQEDEAGEREGYIMEFLNQRSGKPGLFGFIGWMFSKDMWKDFARYAQRKITEQIEALSGEDASTRTDDISRTGLAV